MVSKKLLKRYTCLPTYKKKDNKPKYPCVWHKHLKNTYFGKTKLDPNIAIKKRNKQVENEKEPLVVYTEKNILDGDGIGIRTGKINDLIVIDLDLLNEDKVKKGLRDGKKKWKLLINKYNNGEQYNTPTVKTQSGGTHIYFKYDKEIHDNCQSVNKYTIDVRGHHGYVVMPPTVGYTWKISLEDVEPIEIPEWLKIWILKQKKTVTKSSKNKKQKKQTTQVKKNGSKEVDNKLEPYLECLKIDRFTNYDSWVKICFIIKNEGGTVELFDKYSKLAPNYGGIYEKWENIEGTVEGPQATLKTLKDMAREDNFKKFTRALLKDTKNIIQSIFENGENDTNLAHLFYSYVPKQYVYDNENSELYKINKYGIYEKDTRDNRGLRKHIYDLLTSKLDTEFWYFYNNEQDREKQNKLLDKFRKFRKFISKSYNRKIIADELCTLYGIKKLYEKLDNVNNNIIAFKNGVYDLKNNVFRNAKPEELITCTTGYKYEKANEKYIKKVDDIISSIFSIEEEKEYVLKTISACLFGENKLEEFYIWIGNGSNGKGVLGDMINYTLGGYFDSMDIEYLCKNKNNKSSNGPDPIMARKKNSRIVITTEPEGMARLRTAKLKELSGRDPIQVRDLYKSPFNFVAKFLLIIQTNHEIEIDGADGGICRRLRFINFRNKFVDNPKYGNEKKINRDLKRKIKKRNYSLAFFHTLLKYFKKIEGYTINMPKKIEKETNKYLSNFDPVQEFIDNKIEKTKNKSDFVSINKIYQLFLDYNNGDNRNVSKANMSRILKSKGIKSKRNKTSRGFINIAIRRSDSDDDDDDY